MTRPGTTSRLDLNLVFDGHGWVPRDEWKATMGEEQELRKRLAAALATGGYSLVSDADVALMRAEVVSLREQLVEVTRQRDALRTAILDIDAHAAARSTDEHGFNAGGYVISIGSLHRALGLIGHGAAECSPEHPCSNCEREAVLLGIIRAITGVPGEDWRIVPLTPPFEGVHGILEMVCFATEDDGSFDRLCDCCDSRRTNLSESQVAVFAEVSE